MARFSFTETNHWIITAETEEEAMNLWQLYREEDKLSDAFECDGGLGLFNGEEVE